MNYGKGTTSFQMKIETVYALQFQNESKLPTMVLLSSL